MWSRPPLSRHEHELPMAVLLIDQDDRVQGADPGVRALLGRSEAACEGRPLGEFLPHADLGRVLAWVREAPGRRNELRVLCEDPRRRLLVTLTRLPGHPTLLAALLVAADDWRAEGEKRAASQFRSTLEAVIAGFAHEVRNPLAAILSLSEVALFHLGEASPAADSLARIAPLVARVDKLIKQSLSYSRPRSPQRLRHTLRSLAEWAIELSQLRASPVLLDVVIDDRLGPVLVDAEQAEQVLVNLLCNARDAARSSVRLGACADDVHPERFVRLEVSDDGAGIPRDNQDLIFEPFFSTKANGTGLGLAIARDLARRNGGDLTLRSSSPRGSCFALLLERDPNSDLPP
ncbi:MAG: hypothetical protein EOO75_05670 [Myxococcales bacterium]|nr:MAG: hypothetical protein EOO75_05670 [Myxococcales bacterium]